jgi:CheY-like chemotaxis protein
MDPAQIDQMLANLVVNAKDAIGGAGRIEISTWPVRADECPGETSWSRGVAISIRDDGHGMDETTREQIFEPFFTTKGVGEGTGLGLATVYGIVKQNRGAIEVQSAPGEGAELTIYLPAAYGELNGAADTEVEPEDVPGGTETVLLVEDESAIVSMARDMLAGVGYRVLTSSNPAEALRSARQHRTELKLLVTDVVMPQMNGQDLARIVSEEVPGLAVLFMSGYSADVISDKGVLADGVHFLAKPFTLRQMATAVRRAIDGNVREPLGR